MTLARCISKNRNGKGQIVNYTLQDTKNKIITITGQQIKQAMMNDELNIINLQIDKAGRLVDRVYEYKTGQPGLENIYAVFLINELFEELNKIKPCYTVDDITYTTIGKEYIIPETVKNKWTDIYKIRDYKIYMNMTYGYIKELRMELGNFLFIQDYNKQYQRILASEKERNKDKYQYLVEHGRERDFLVDIEDLCQAELRDERKALNDRVPKAHTVIKSFEQQYNVRINYEIIKGVVVIKGITIS